MNYEINSIHKKKIAVMGLINFDNLGDQLVVLCVKYLVEKCGYEGVETGFQPERIGKRFNIYKKMRRIVNKYVPKSVKDILYYWIMRWFVKPHYENIIRNTDALIFATGSYKYSTQNTWMTFSIAIDVAKKYGKPVMFHGMNIEEYRANDWRCRHLKRRTNFDVVKSITTRDGEFGENLLLEGYVDNKKIHVAQVGDSAFWLKEYLEYSPKERKNVIGINLIRKGIILDYGGSITPEQLKKVYIDLIKGFDERKIEWELFTNGNIEDYDFGIEILNELGRNEKMLVVPETPKELVDRIGEYKAVVGAKLHACIISYVTDTPLVGLCWESKVQCFSSTNELEERFCNMDELSGERIIQILNATIDKPYNSKLRDSWKDKNIEEIKLFLEMNT